MQITFQIYYRTNSEQSKEEEPFYGSTLHFTQVNSKITENTHLQYAEEVHLTLLKKIAKKKKKTDLGCLRFTRS